MEQVHHHCYQITTSTDDSRSSLTHLEVRDWIETLDDFVCFKRAVEAVTDRHQTTVTTLQVQTVFVTVDKTDVCR